MDAGLLDRAAFLVILQLIDVGRDEGGIATARHVGYQVEILFSLPANLLDVVYAMSGEQ
ncbi:hypothetical protein WEI85_03925 [Actinomycetes bacterium KLBMP 9797]